MDIDEYGF